jgi:hypothetical protein
METELTIVIPANEADAPLLRLLTSLCRQDYAELPVTKVFLLAPDESTDTVGESEGINKASRPSGYVPNGIAPTLPEIASTFTDQLAVELIPCGLESFATRRNAGATLATTPYILFLDPDVELPYRAGPERDLDRSLLRRAVETIVRRRLHLVTASSACLHGCFLDDVLSMANNLIQHASAFLRPFAACASTGMFLLVDRKEFLRLGGFNEQAAFAEGALLSKAIQRERFHLLPGRIQTTNRRMREIGHGRIARGLLRAMFHTGKQQFVLHNNSIGNRKMHPPSSYSVWMDYNEQPLAPGQHEAVGSL